jgi:D-cysteine desulfhydrase
VTLPLQRRFPALDQPRVQLGTFPTPVQRVTLHDGRSLLLKRDDLSATPIGGNKVRGLEWLLGGVARDDRVLTVGPLGSTHALATATYARQLGAIPVVVRWTQEMNDAAHVIEARIRRTARVIDARNLAAAYAVATVLRMRADHWIPAGGATAVAILGHVNAALELAEQIEAGDCERPGCIIVPFGTGGTAAGLALGLRIAGLGVPVVAVRVVPRIIGSRLRILRLARSAARLLERVSWRLVPAVRGDAVVVEHAFFGGAYGRALPVDSDNESALAEHGVTLDDTYSRKAFAAAMQRDDRVPLLWLTFDGRVVRSHTSFS